MVSLKNKKGFTIVELLIVIVVIGILATLVIVTFTGIQQKGRNSQRQTDINAVQSHVESFYAQHGFYPALGDMNNAAFVQKYMKGLDPEALKDPKGSASTLANAAAASVYSYVTEGTCTAQTGSPLPDEPTQATGSDCTGYTLTATLEPSGTYIKKSN